MDLVTLADVLQLSGLSACAAARIVARVHDVLVRFELDPEKPLDDASCAYLQHVAKQLRDARTGEALLD